MASPWKVASLHSFSNSSPTCYTCREVADKFDSLIKLVIWGITSTKWDMSKGTSFFPNWIICLGRKKHINMDSIVCHRILHNWIQTFSQLAWAFLVEWVGIPWLLHCNSTEEAWAEYYEVITRLELVFGTKNMEIRNSSLMPTQKHQI